jgi:hypothetical protein
MTPDQKVYAAHNPDIKPDRNLQPVPFFAPVDEPDDWKPVSPVADLIFVMVAVAIVAAEVGAIWFIYHILHTKGLL